MASGAGRLLISGVTLIDGTGAPPLPDAAVLIDGERIAYAGPRRGLGDASAEVVVDGAGKFVVPGLIDLHNHSTFDADMRARLKDRFGLENVPVINQPTEMEGACQLLAHTADGCYQFQWRALGAIDAKPVGGPIRGEGKKGPDRGID